MTKNIVALCFLVLVGSTASAEFRLLDNSCDFAAPVVGRKTALNDVAAGQIVFEPSTGFWGLTSNGGASSAAN